MGEMADLLTEQLLKRIDDREEDWDRGIHRVKDGRFIKIKDMQTSHIENCIDKFKGRFDVSSFQKELLIRN